MQTCSSERKKRHSRPSLSRMRLRLRVNSKELRHASSFLASLLLATSLRLSIMTIDSPAPAETGSDAMPADRTPPAAPGTFLFFVFVATSCDCGFYLLHSPAAPLPSLMVKPVGRGREGEGEESKGRIEVGKAQHDDDFYGVEIEGWLQCDDVMIDGWGLPAPYSAHTPEIDTRRSYEYYCTVQYTKPLVILLGVLWGTRIQELLQLQ